MSKQLSKEEPNLLYRQVRCDKHDMVTVTQTTTTKGIDVPDKVVQWMQCKNCSYTIPLPQQNFANQINNATGFRERRKGGKGMPPAGFFNAKF